MVSGASKTFKVLMEAVFCFKDALEGVDCSTVFLASCGKLFQQHVFLDHNLPKVQQVGGLRGGMMVDHVSNKGISAHGHLFWAVLMGIFILGSAHLEYLGWLLLFCKCGHVAAACNVVCDKPNRLSS